jgi:hypothetical protein
MYCLGSQLYLETTLVDLADCGWQGPRGMLYFVKHGKEAVRSAPVSRGETVDAKGRPIRDKVNLGAGAC